MKFLIFLFFIIPSLSLFAKPFFYEGFSETNSKNHISMINRINPHYLSILTDDLSYTNGNVLKSSGKALKVHDGKFYRFFIRESNVQLNSSDKKTYYISFLFKVDKIYDKKYSAVFSLCRIRNTNFFSIDMHRNINEDSQNSFLRQYKNIPGFTLYDCKKKNIDLSKQIIRKNTIMVLLVFTKEKNKKHLTIIFNPIIGENNVKIDEKKTSIVLSDEIDEFYRPSMFTLSTKGIDAVFDEIRVGTSMEDVLPQTDHYGLSEEELLDSSEFELSDAVEKQSDTGTDTSFSVSNSVLDSIVIINGDETVGTGFVVCENSNNYIYTNIHVLMGNKKMKLINRNGKKFTPVSIETTYNRDVVRLKIKEKNLHALTIAKSPGNNVPIAVSGNSGGGDVIRTIYGKILGTGPTKIETDAKFISGNSGSPLMLEDGSVIGIATYIRKANVDWTNTNTPFGVTRRFAYRIDNIKKWKKISPKTFIKEANILKQREKKIIDFIDIFGIWARSPYWSKIQLNNENIPYDMRLWIEKHNEWVDHNKMRFKHTSARNSNVRNLSKELIKEFGENVETLKKSFKRTTDFKKRRWAVPFFKDYAADINRFRNVILKGIDSVAAEATAHDPVRLKRNQ